MKNITCTFVYIFFGVFLISPNLVNGQSKTMINTAERLRYDISHNYKPNNGALSDSCINSIIYLKFKIINQQIDSLDFSLNSPILVKNALQKSIAISNLQLKTSDPGLQLINNRTVLLPVILRYQSGCDPSSTITLAMLEKKSDIINVNTNIQNALTSMLFFEKGGKYSMLDCIILKPITFGNYF